MRGRKRTPIALRRLHGNSGHRPLPSQRAQPRPGAHCPSWLPGAAKAKWRRLGPVLKRLGLLTEIDEGAFTLYCVAWARFVHASQRIEREGPTITAGNKTLIPHPLIAIMNAAMKQLCSLGAEFGLSPTARASLAIPGPVEDDAIDKRFFGPYALGRPKRREDGEGDEPTEDGA